MRYGFVYDVIRSQKAIAESFNVSRVRIQYIEKHTLKKIRNSSRIKYLRVK